MANPFVHVELSTTDLAKAKSFYAALFSWTLSEVPMGPGQSYTMIGVGDGVGGGMMTQPVPGAPSGWLAYVAVDDIHAATEKARGLGASVVREPIAVMGAGWLSIIVDPTGAPLGMWQAVAQ
jgi:predicted enzyme related to lactoylglutathione lyase